MCVELVTALFLSVCEAVGAVHAKLCDLNEFGVVPEAISYREYQGYYYMYLVPCASFKASRVYQEKRGKVGEEVSLMKVKMEDLRTFLSVLNDLYLEPEYIFGSGEYCYIEMRNTRELFEKIQQSFMLE